MLNRLKEIFTQEYIQETTYRDFMKKHIDSFKFKDSKNQRRIDMGLTTDLPPQKFEYESTSGINWNFDGVSVAKVGAFPDNSLGVEYAQGYAKSKADMQKKINAAIKEIEELAAYSFIYNKLNQVVDTTVRRNEVIDIIKKLIGSN